MIKAFWEVVVDLWSFVFPRKRQDVKSTFPEKEAPHSVVKAKGQTTTLFADAPTLETVLSERKAYVVVDEAVCLTDPKLLFDTLAGRLTYGEQVAVSHISGSFAHVETSHCQGWVATEALTDDGREVFPIFRSTFTYRWNDTETLRLRRYIKDESLAHQLKLPLQSVEYILFTLKYLNIKVTWPPERPREPGTWQSLLRGVRGVTMGVEPRTSAVLEYAGNGTGSFLGHVEAVNPDQSIMLRSVGREQEGEYRAERFSKDEWKEWRPVFISFA